MVGLYQGHDIIAQDHLGGNAAKTLLRVKIRLRVNDSLVAGGVEISGDGPDGAVRGNDAKRGAEVIDEFDDRQRPRVGAAAVEGREVQGACFDADRQILGPYVPQLVVGVRTRRHRYCEISANGRE